jgi:iron complex outermembrane receptor protein
MGQDCHFTLSGVISDAHKGGKIKEARVFIREVNSAKYTSSSGQFQFTQLCKGEYHLEVSQN